MCVLSMNVEAYLWASHTLHKSQILYLRMQKELNFDGKRYENLYLLRMKRDLSWTAVLCALIYLLPFIWSARAKESN